MLKLLGSPGVGVSVSGATGVSVAAGASGVSLTADARSEEVDVDVAVGLGLVGVALGAKVGGGAVELGGGGGASVVAAGGVHALTKSATKVTITNNRLRFDISLLLLVHNDEQHPSRINIDVLSTLVRLR